MIDELSGS